MADGTQLGQTLMQLPRRRPINEHQTQFVALQASSDILNTKHNSLSVSHANTVSSYREIHSIRTRADWLFKPARDE